MISSPIRLSVLSLASILLMGAATSGYLASGHGQAFAEPGDPDMKHAEENAIKVQYLEIATPAVNETCEVLAQTHGVVFSDPIPGFGNARTADLAGGGRLGVRAPMRATEAPIVRPYLLVDDIESAVKAAEKAGGMVALPPMEIPGQGMFSIYILGGIEHGLWQH